MSTAWPGLRALKSSTGKSASACWSSMGLCVSARFPSAVAAERIVEMESKERPDGRQILSIVIADAKGRCVEGIWFGQFYLLSKLRYGQKVAYSGKPKWHRDHWQMNHPRAQPLNEGAA